MNGDFNQNGADNNMNLTEGIDEFDNVKINLHSTMDNPEMIQQQPGL